MAITVTRALRRERGAQARQLLLLNQHFQVAPSFWVTQSFEKSYSDCLSQFIAFDEGANFQRLLLCHFP